MPGRQGYTTKTHYLKNADLGSLLQPADPSEADFTATKVVVTIGPSCQDVDTLSQLLQAGATCARCDLTWGTKEFHRLSLQNLNEAMQKTRKLCAIMLDTTGREITVMREHEIDEKGWPEHVNQMEVKQGQKLIITTKEGADASDNVLPVSYPNFTSMVQKGDSIFVGRYLVTGSEDSSLYLTVDEVDGDEVQCTANTHAVLDGLVTVFHTERSPDALNNVQNDLPIMTEQDKQGIKDLGQEFEIDFISLSFTRSGECIHVAREFLDSIGMTNTKLIAKCETRQSLFNFKAIAQEADAIMLSRGNLGLDVLPEKMALVQKHVIQQCNLLGKPAIVTRVVDTMISSPRPTSYHILPNRLALVQTIAVQQCKLLGKPAIVTRVVDTMISYPRPTWAEATDVANAVLDGVDCIMLGAETLRGRHPVATVETILHICKQAEKVFDHHYHFETLMREALDPEDLADYSDVADGLHRTTSNMSNTSDFKNHGRSPNGHGSSDSLKSSPTPRPTPVMSKLESIASSAVRAADKVQASLIIVYTHTGHTASLVSKYRPSVPILTLVIPQLKTEGSMKWKLEGRATARQCQISRSLFPVLAAPSPSGETLLEEVVLMSSKVGLVKPKDHIVCVQRMGESYVIKIVSVNDDGDGVEIIRPKSLENLMRAAAGVADHEPINFDGINGPAKHSVNSGARQIAAGSLTPASEAKEGSATEHRKGVMKETPHLANLPTKQSTSEVSAIEPGQGGTAQTSNK